LAVLAALENPMTAKPAAGEPVLAPLENGGRLTAGEFLRRDEAMREVKRAELIEGIV
jgi:hypothetical protein